MPRLLRAESKRDNAHAKELFGLYAASLDFDLEFQDFQQELSDFPGRYGPPTGVVLLVEEGDEIIGCVALRKLDENICEMKRLYVRPEYRGRNAGRLLVKGLIEEARRLGYTLTRLDTMPSMDVARALYTSFGFRQIDAYRHNPCEGAIFMELDLRES